LDGGGDLRRITGPNCLGDLIQPDRDEQPGCQPPCRTPDVGGDDAPEHQPDEWHPGLEHAEYHADLDPCPVVDPAGADSDGPGEVGQTHRDRRQQEQEYPPR
jgi:hypothetical protein